MLDASNGATIDPDCQSTSLFYAAYDSGFTVMPDQATIIGVDESQKTLIMERIADPHSGGRSVKFGKHGRGIRTILLLEKSGILLAGDNSNRIVQYQLDPAKGTWAVAREYRDVGISEVRSRTRLGHLAIFGGSNGSIRVINTRTSQLVGEPYKTGVQKIRALSICHVGTSQTLLSLTGYSINYSGTLTDVLDVSGLASSHNVQVRASTHPANDSEPASEVGDHAPSRTDAEPEPRRCACDTEAVFARLAAKLEHHIQGVLVDLLAKVLPACAVDHGKSCI